jgi:hypothetical protein
MEQDDLQLYIYKVLCEKNVMVKPEWMLNVLNWLSDYNIDYMMLKPIIDG